MKNSSEPLTNPNKSEKTTPPRTTTSTGNEGVSASEGMSAQQELDSFFTHYITKPSVFLNKKALYPSFTPEEILYRDEQMRQFAQMIAPSLKGEKPSNIFVYGKTGSGKTLTIRRVALQAALHSSLIKVCYVNCKMKKVADTEYRLLLQLCQEFGKEFPATGLPTDELYKAFFSSLRAERKITLVILDEVDQLIKKCSDDILYNLTRAHEEVNDAQIAVAGISNDLTFLDNIDPRVKSSLSEEELIFPPYNALQLQGILAHRAKQAFRDGSVEYGVLEKCAAYAAKEHGDARRAIDLLRVASEIAERNDFEKVTMDCVDLAEEKIERDRILDTLTHQPKQHQAVLYSMIVASDGRRGPVFTGEAYETYKKVCTPAGLRPLTQRRVSDIISELDMLGILRARVASKGRYGRTTEIELAIDPKLAIRKILEDGLSL